MTHVLHQNYKPHSVRAVLLHNDGRHLRRGSLPSVRRRQRERSRRQQQQHLQHANKSYPPFDGFNIAGSSTVGSSPQRLYPKSRNVSSRKRTAPTRYMQSAVCSRVVAWYDDATTSLGGANNRCARYRFSDRSLAPADTR